MKNKFQLVAVLHRDDHTEIPGSKREVTIEVDDQPQAIDFAAGLIPSLISHQTPFNYGRAWLKRNGSDIWSWTISKDGKVIDDSTSDWDG